MSHRCGCRAAGWVPSSGARGLVSLSLSAQRGRFRWSVCTAVAVNPYPKGVREESACLFGQIPRMTILRSTIKAVPSRPVVRLTRLPEAGFEVVDRQPQQLTSA